MTFRELFQRAPGRDERDTRSGARVIAEALKLMGWTPSGRLRTGKRYMHRKAKPARENFLTLLSRVKMRDWAAFDAEAKADKSGMPLGVVRLGLLRRDRNRRKAARQAVAS